MGAASPPVLSPPTTSYGWKRWYPAVPAVPSSHCTLFRAHRTGARSGGIWHCPAEKCCTPEPCQLSTTGCHSSFSRWSSFSYREPHLFTSLPRGSCFLLVTDAARSHHASLRARPCCATVNGAGSSVCSPATIMATTTEPDACFLPFGPVLPSVSLSSSFHPCFTDLLARITKDRENLKPLFLSKVNAVKW